MKELATGLFDINRSHRITGSDHVVEVQPARNELFAAVLDQPALEGRLRADKEGLAFRG